MVYISAANNNRFGAAGVPDVAEIEPHPFSLRTDYRMFDDWYYVSSASMLVYSTTLIDTFLSETMAFLYALYPKSIGNEAKIPLTEIVEAGSKFAVINMPLKSASEPLGSSRLLLGFSLLTAPSAFQSSWRRRIRRHWRAVRNCGILSFTTKDCSGFFWTRLVQ